MYLVNVEKLKSVIEESGWSYRMIAQLILDNPSKNQISATAVRICSLVNKDTKACELEFLQKIEKGLNLKSGAITGQKITNEEARRQIRLEKSEKLFIANQVTDLLKTDDKNILVSKELLKRILSVMI
jgi:hypothetical protein